MEQILDQKSYLNALKELEIVFNAKEGTPEAIKERVLTKVIKAYEDRNYIFEPPSPLEAIKLAMEERNMTTRDLGEFVGGKRIAYLLLSKKRKLSLHNISLLSQILQIPTSILIQDYLKGGQ